MNSTNPILIYAERLSNIRQISISCLLYTPATSATKISITSNGEVFSVNHDGVKASICLPGPVLSSQRINSGWPIGTKELSLRLPLAPAGPTSQEEHTVPWSANDLQPESPIACRQCQATVVDAGLIKVWKDLPSENWAEMMEFWHCHKPDHAHAHDDNLTSRAYGANSRISAQAGVGFVDLTSFLLSEADISASTVSTSLLKSSDGYLEGGQASNLASQWHGHRYKYPRPSYYSALIRSYRTLAFSYGIGIVFWNIPLYFTIARSLSVMELNKNSEDMDETGSPNAPKGENSPIFCTSCKNQLGVLNDQSSVSLFKWRVHVCEKSQPATRIEPSLDHCFSAMLLATMTRSGCSKSIILPMKVQPESSPPQLLNIWVFNGNIAFSSTQSPSPVLAVRVFYRMVSQAEADKMLESMTSDVQDINLPGDAIHEVLGILDRSNGFLPPSNRLFKEWKVGLLEKWDKD